MREWEPGEGSLTFSDGARIVLSEGADEGLKAVAELFARELSDRLGTEVSLLLEGDGLKPEAGDIFLSASSGEASEGLGEEGYRMVLNAQSASGERVWTHRLFRAREPFPSWRGQHRVSAGAA